MKERLVVLSIDVPGKHEGGYVVWYPNDPEKNGPEHFVFGPILFSDKHPERHNYLSLIQPCLGFQPSVVIMEHPFLYSIAQHIGALKLWVSMTGGSWWMVGASKAKKLVFDNGRATKDKVKAWAEQKAKQPLTQHCADALLYLEAWKIDQFSREENTDHGKS